MRYLVGTVAVIMFGVIATWVAMLADALRVDTSLFNE